MTDLGLGLPALIVLPLLVALAAGLSALGGLGYTRQIPLSALRALLQLAVVGLIVAWALSSYPGTALFLTMMLIIAALTSGRRIRALPRAIPNAAIAITVPALVVLAAIVVSGAVPQNPATLLPLGGILIGGAMSATSVAGRRIIAELEHGRGQVDAALSLGFKRRQAIRLVVGRSAADALLPSLDQTRTVGLVTLPGTFVGMVLGGSTPLQAAAFQLVVLICLLTVVTASILLITELVALTPPQD